MNDVTADQGGNIWVAGGGQGLYLLRSGSTQFQQFNLGNGLHPWAYPASGGVLDALSVAGGAAGNVYVGYNGQGDCEDEWDANEANPDPDIYKSGDADHVWLSGSGIQVAHYDIFTGVGQVDIEPRGREKLCTVYRMVYDAAHGNVWAGANHGVAWLDPSYTGNPPYAGDDVTNGYGLREHFHPALNGYLTDDAPVQDDFLLTGGYYGMALEPNGDVWVGGIFRSYRCAGGSNAMNFWTCEEQATQAPYQVDVWPDPEPTDARPSQRVDDYVSGMAVMPDGSVWVSARNHQDNPSQAQAMGVGLAHLDGTGKVLGYLTDGMLSTHLTAVAADPNGTLWVGSEQGLMRYNPGAGVVYQFGTDAVGGRAGDSISNIQVDTHSNPRRVLVGFQSGAVGIYTGT